jgi:hypothetical protein
MWISGPFTADDVVAEDPMGIESEQERLMISVGGFSTGTIPSGTTAEFRDSAEPGVVSAQRLIEETFRASGSTQPPTKA